MTLCQCPVSCARSWTGHETETCNFYIYILKMTSMLKHDYYICMHQKIRMFTCLVWCRYSLHRWICRIDGKKNLLTIALELTLHSFCFCSQAALTKDNDYKTSIKAFKMLLSHWQYFSRSKIKNRLEDICVWCVIEGLKDLDNRWKMPQISF